MSDAIERKKQSIRARAAASPFPAEVEACNAALERLERRSPTREAVKVKAGLVQPDPFGIRTTVERTGPRPVDPLMPHQRKAWRTLAAGGGRLSRTENSFLHRMRESRYISPRQERWLDDLARRLDWEASLS